MAYLFFVEVVTVGWAAFAIGHAEVTSRSSFVFGLLLVLALAFEEGAARAARLQLRLSSDLKRDMTSVWTVACIVALPPAQAIVLLALILTYVWHRQYKRAGQPVYRGVFTGSTVILGALCAGAVMRLWWHVGHSLPWALVGSIAVLVAIVVHTAVNRALITVALFGVGVRGRMLVGRRDENLAEFATLCLGGLVALAAIYQPWLCILVIAPMVSLQRGTLVRELETAATTDAKTGLLNAVAWEQVAKRELTRAARTSMSLAVLIIDADRFKRINDTFGHLVGDSVLRHIGKCLEREVREYDTVGRFGGEEFVAVLPETGDEGALAIAERLRVAINELRVSQLVDDVVDDGDDRLSVSIGVACAPFDGVELTDLLHAADSALYQAKAYGRNCVVLADRGMGDQAHRVTA